LKTDVAELPLVSGYPDLTYLRQALARIGRPFQAAELEQAPLSGGRTGAGIQQLKVGDASYVVKVFERDRWMDVAMGESNRGEVKLWLSGVTRELPAPLACPTIDIAYHPERGEHWMLMEDVSSGIRPRGAFDENDTRILFRAMARLHARFWGRDELDALPLASLGALSEVCAQTVLYLSGRREHSPPWVPRVLEGFVVLREFVPIFLNTLEARDADFYLELCARRSEWLAWLRDVPHTLVHGDLRRANIALLPDRVSLFDWELATRGPSAIDVAWHSYLQFWAYPVADGRGPGDRRPLVDDYLDHLESELGERIDRTAFDRALDICFLKVLVEIGCLLIDPLSGKHDRDDVVRVKARCADAFALARRVYEQHVR
jgi:hypothetical protein